MITIGNKILALIGKGINIIIISALGYNAVKAATTPNIAPDAHLPFLKLMTAEK
ncbi:MAG: hypothetical protein U0T78_07925 [Cloacibacterium normanense]